MLDVIRKYNEDSVLIQRKVRHLEKLISSHQRQIKRLERMDVGWVKGALVPIAEALSARRGMPYEIFGPFGMRGETSIYLFDTDNHSFTHGASAWGITVCPVLAHEGDDCILSLTYDTGETTRECAPGSIGELNGFNNVTAKLPDTIEEIDALLHYCGSGDEAEGGADA